MIKRGFTLVELLVTLALISLLVGAMVFILKPSDYIKRSRDARRLSDLGVIQTALEQAYGNENVYPALIPTDGGAFKSGDGTVTYLNTTPKDPDTAKIYCYAKDYTCAGAAKSGAYFLCSALEISPTSSSCAPPGGAVSGTCLTTAYNYCLTNPF